MRVARAEMELGYAKNFDRTVVNDNLDVAKQQTKDIICEFLGK